MQLNAEQERLIKEQKEHCPFCKMISGEIPVEKVYEDGDFLAILDINPASRGHTLLFPKEHHPILPLLPPELQSKLGKRISEMSAALAKATVNPRVEVFVANGGAAGQQSSHFLVHLIPGEKQRFAIPGGDSKAHQQTEALLRRQFGSTKRDSLTNVLSQNEELRRIVIEQPDELVKNLHTTPELAQLFAGVDIMELAKRLRENETPRALVMSDEQLMLFLNQKEKLRSLLIDDPTGLQQAIAAQPKLQKFFEGTTVASVRERLLRGKHHV